MGEYPLRWPLIPYFLARYSGLASLIANLIYVYPPKEVDCQALRSSIVVFGNIAMITSSGNLMIRAIIIWDYKRWVTIALCLLFGGQWVLGFAALRIWTVRWNRLIGGCVPVDPEPNYMFLLGAFSIYTMGFDFIVAVIAVLGVKKTSKDGLAALLRRQGIWYLGLILLLHTATVILVFYDVESFLGIYGGLAAVVFSPIVACRFVRAVFQGPSQRGTKPSAPSSWDTSRSSRSAPQQTDMQLTTRIQLTQSETDDLYEMQLPIEKHPRRPGSPSGWTAADNV